MKDNRKLDNRKNTKKCKWLNLDSRPTLVMKAAWYNYIRRCIDSLLQSVKLIKGKNLNM